VGLSAPSSRDAALAVLSEVLNRRRPLDAALDSVSGLEPRDANFTRAIVGETLRRLGQLEDMIHAFVPKPMPRHKSGPALEILLLGACELLFLDVAPHAAVDGANRLAAGDAKAVHFKPLINAVLRRVSREGKAMIAAQDAARLNTPDWLWGRWCDSYGEETARAIANAHLSIAPLDVVGDAPPDAAHLFGHVSRLAAHARVDVLPGFAEGKFWVQDAAATLPALLFGDVRGRRVLDLCAAPGGKTAELAAAGANVVAVEREESRMARLHENLARLKLQAQTVVADVRDCTVEPAPFVLLDAPCSATGTIRRHPELPWIKEPGDVTLCAAAATELLDAAAALTAPGGLLVFAVCSLEREEGIEQAEYFLSRHEDFTREPVAAAEMFGHDEWLANGDLRTLPCHLADVGGMDGFYAARFKKKGCRLPG
jgi:16S rRNA (cytosine967-C5)-methyltransferase